MGPSDAYGYAARNAKRLDGTSVGVTRIRTTKDGYGNVYVYVATASGAVPGSASDPTTDLGAVNEAIQHNAAALGDTAHTLAAVPVAIAVNYSIWLYNSLSLTQEQIENAIEAELADFMASQPIGGNIIGTDPGKIFTSAISAAIARAKISDVSSLRGVKVQVNLPASDVPLAISEVPTLGTVASNDLVLLAAQGSS
jgi:uncharacterized phage protein gp47/JayE